MWIIRLLITSLFMSDTGPGRQFRRMAWLVGGVVLLIVATLILLALFASRA